MNRSVALAWMSGREGSDNFTPMPGEITPCFFVVRMCCQMFDENPFSCLSFTMDMEICGTLEWIPLRTEACICECTGCNRTKDGNGEQSEAPPGDEEPCRSAGVLRTQPFSAASRARNSSIMRFTSAGGAWPRVFFIT